MAAWLIDPGVMKSLAATVALLGRAVGGVSPSPSANGAPANVGE